MPETCIGKTFEHLFNTLLERKLVTMALYRLRRGLNGSESPYVVTNPAEGALITHRDKAFVLGIEIPADLQGDVYEMMEQEGSLPLTLTSNTQAAPTAPNRDPVGPHIQSRGDGDMPMGGGVPNTGAANTFQSRGKRASYLGGQLNTTDMPSTGRVDHAPNGATRQGNMLLNH